MKNKFVEHKEENIDTGIYFYVKLLILILLNNKVYIWLIILYLMEEIFFK
jgi:hypothetical protein